MLLDQYIDEFKPKRIKSVQDMYKIAQFIDQYFTPLFIEVIKT